MRKTAVADPLNSGIEKTAGAKKWSGTLVDFEPQRRTSGHLKTGYVATYLALLPPKMSSNGKGADAESQAGTARRRKT